MTIHWDDLEILGAVYRLEGEGRAYMMSGEDLLHASAGGRAVEEADRNAFARMLLMLRDGTPRYLAFDQQPWPNITPPVPQQHEYLQSLWHFQLTPKGRDRATARVVFEGLPDPDQDDGRVIPALVLDDFADIIGTYFTGAQLPRFLYDAGLSNDRARVLVNDQRTKTEYVSSVLSLLEAGSAEQRRVLRSFLARVLNGGFRVLATTAQHRKLKDELAQAGWQIEPETLVIGDPQRTLMPTEGEETRPGPTTLSGLHPLIGEAAEALWVGGHRREAIQRAATAVLDAVRQQSGLDLDGKSLMARAFSPENPTIVVADLRTENGRNLQAGTHLIAMGAVAAIRNPVSHTLADHDEQQAREQLAVLSFVARRLDDARNASPEWRESE